MKIHNGPAILCAVLLFGAVLVSPAFADMEKVDEAELAQTNASVIGASEKDWNAGSVLADGTFDKTERAFSPSVSKASEDFSLNMSSPGPETWSYNYGAFNPNYYGSITGAISR